MFHLNLARILWFSGLTVICQTQLGFSQQAADRSELVVKAAQELQRSLPQAQQSDLMFKFDDVPQKLRWSNLPTGIFARKGLRMGDLNQLQRDAVMKLIEATLSPAGYRSILDNIEAEETLRKNSSGGRTVFGKDEFYVSILGNPSLNEPWMWQFGGHHLAINATIVGSRITLGPTLTGGQPMSFQLAGSSIHQMKAEIDLAHQLVVSLSDSQRSIAVRSGQVGDMILGPGKEHLRPEPEGIPAEQLNSEQQQLLLQLVEQRVGLLNPEDSSQRMLEIKHELSKTYFCWSGPVDKDSPAYYRVQGASYFMEFAPQRMGGDLAQHVHAMYREFDNDYGERWAAQFRQVNADPSNRE